MQYKSRTIATAKAMSETLSKVSFDSLTNDTAKHNYENMLGILTRLSVVAENYEKLCHSDHSLIRAYEDKICALEAELLCFKYKQESNI